MEYSTSQTSTMTRYTDLASPMIVGSPSAVGYPTNQVCECGVCVCVCVVCVCVCGVCVVCVCGVCGVCMCVVCVWCV